MRTNRRDFLRLSLAGSAALSTLGAGATLSGCGTSAPAPGMKRLRVEDVAMLTAVTPAVLVGVVGPGDSAKLKAMVESMDTLLDDASAAAIAGAYQAFDVLTMGLTRGLTTGQWSSWSDASLQDAQSALARLRDSGIDVLNTLYAALARLVASAWYLMPESYAGTGYPGPPKKVLSSAADPSPEPDAGAVGEPPDSKPDGGSPTEPVSPSQETAP